MVVKQEKGFNPLSMKSEQRKIHVCQKEEAEEVFKSTLGDILSRSTKEMKFTVKLSTEKGASSWLTARPLFDHSTVLCKGDFRDAINIRYGWEPRNLPDKCACGASFKP